MFESYKDVLTVDDVCRALSLGKNTVYSLLKNGTIKSIKVGKKYLIPKLYLIDFVNNSRF
ncbi:MAG: helix-turn-helix domain-containing protein [Clostridia bacterium]|nr:helix-turn-helix domain-containing protein [Clostridia bacterium]